MIFLLILLFVPMTSLNVCCGSSCDSNSKQESLLTPSRLIVKFGDPASVTCQVCQPQNRNTFSIEVPLGKVDRNETTAVWKVDKMTEWDFNMICFYQLNGKQLLNQVDVTVYQPPQNVSISFVDQTGQMNESVQYTLQCSVTDVAPAENLIVTFYRGQTPLNHMRSSSKQKEPVSETFRLSYNISKEDDGAQFWCEAKLELELEGPQHPPVVASEKLTATVHYAPVLLVSGNPDLIEITEGENLTLNCSAEGNPSPSYSWTFPSSVSHYSPIYTVASVGLEDGGSYNCTVKNTVGSVQVIFNVKIQRNFILYIIVGVVLFVVILLMLMLIIYLYYYRHNKMGHYSLKDVFRLHSRHTQVPVRE